MVSNNYSTVSFLSDYGNKDEFVGVVKSVIHSIAHEVSVIDITHGIKPHDIRAGSLALARASQYLLYGHGAGSRRSQLSEVIGVPLRLKSTMANTFS